MNSINRFFASHLYRPLLSKYLERERSYEYMNLEVKVLPGVFHPGFFFSSKYLLQHVMTYPLAGKTVLEPGAGSGFISLMAERCGAIVTASDISLKAIENLELNKKLLQSQITIICSDLFDYIPPFRFDYLIINPPYYPKHPATDQLRAWYCGENFEYFEKLFSGLSTYIHGNSRTWMVLSQDCDLERIRDVAVRNRFFMQEVSRKKIWWEWNYIFEISRTDDP